MTMSSDGPSAYVSQAEFSRLKGVSRKTATIWKQKGWLVVTDAGLVDVAATEALLAQRPTTYRGGSTVAPGSVTATVTDAPVTKRNGKGNPAGSAPADPSQEPAPPLVDENGKPIPSMAEATRLKEHYLALQRKHEHEIRNREWVRIEGVGTQVEREYAVVRERLMTIPGAIAASLDRAKARFDWYPSCCQMTRLGGITWRTVWTCQTQHGGISVLQMNYTAQPSTGLNRGVKRLQDIFTASPANLP